MLSNLAIVCIISCAFCVQISVGKECTEEAIRACTAGSTAATKDLVPKDFDAQCQALKDTAECLLRKLQGCQSVPNLQPQYGSAKNFTDAMCAPQSSVRKLYEKHGKCLSTLEADLKSCQENLLSAFSRPASGQDQMIARACCGQTQLVDCTVSVVTKKCSAEAAQFVTEAQKIATNVNAQAQACNSYKAADARCKPYLFHNSGNSLMSSVILEFFIVIAIAMII